MTNFSILQSNSNIYNHYITWKGKDYSVTEIIELSKSYPSITVDIRSICMDYSICENNLLDFALNMKRVLKANLRYPIILAPDGYLLDGRHRIVKCLIKDIKTIKLIRLNTMPGPYRDCIT